MRIFIAFGVFMKIFYIILGARNSIQGPDNSCELPLAQKLTDNNEVFTFRLSRRSMQPCYRMSIIGFRKIEFLFPLEEGIFMRKLNSQQWLLKASWNGKNRNLQIVFQASVLDLLVQKGVPEKVTIFFSSEGKAIRNKRILFVYLHMYSEGFMQLEANFIMVGIQ